MNKYFELKRKKNKEKAVPQENNFGMELAEGKKREWRRRSDSLCSCGFRLTEGPGKLR